MSSNLEDRGHWHLIKYGPKRPADHISLDEREAAALAKMAEGSTEIIRTEGTEPVRRPSGDEIIPGETK